MKKTSDPSSNPSRTGPTTRRGRYLKRVLLFTLASLYPSMASAARPEPLAKWQGDAFASKEGGAYMTFNLIGFGGNQQARKPDTPLQILLINMLQKKRYLISQAPDTLTPESAPLIWTLPAGKYAVASIRFVDSTGKPRMWKANKKTLRRFIVKRAHISNLGMWLMKPKGNTQLLLAFRMIPNRYNGTDASLEPSKIAIIDGFTGSLQARLRDDNSPSDSLQNAGEKNEVKSAQVRTISLKWTLNLYKDVAQKEKIEAILSENDFILRKCYMDSLQKKPELKGSLYFGFLMTKGTGKIKKLKRVGGDINDPTLVRCIGHRLAHMKFPASKNMIGKIMLEFNVF